MSQAILDRLSEEREQITQFVEQTLTNVEGRDLSDAEIRSVNDAKARIEAIEAQAKPLAEFMSARASSSDLSGILSRAESRSVPTKGAAETRSMGEIFTESEVFKTYPGRGTSSRLQIEDRALPMTLGSLADGLPRPQRIDLTPIEVVSPILSLIGNVPVSQNSVETIVWAKTAGGAEVVPEGSLKPSMEFAPTVDSFVLDTIAVWTSATRQLLEDAPAIRAKIDSELRREVVRKMESEATAVLAGATLPTTSGATLLAGIRKGIGVVQAAGFTPNAVLLNPSDFADLDIEVFGSTLLGPSRSGSFWGIRPVPSNDQPVGTVTVGDFSTAIQRYVRSGVSLYITDSHADLFLKNVFVLLAEARAKTVVTRPDALVTVTSTKAAAAPATK